MPRSPGQARDVKVPVAALGTQGAQAGARGGLPEPHRPIEPDAGEQLTIRGQSHGPDKARVATQRGRHLAGVRPPQAERPVRTDAGPRAPSAECRRWNSMSTTPPAW